MRLDNSLIPKRREIGDVHVVLVAQRREYIVSAIIDSGKGKLGVRDVKQPGGQPDSGGRNEYHQPADFLP